MMRPSGKLKKFITNADYQVSAKRTKKKEFAFSVRGKKSGLVNAGTHEIGVGRLNVAPAPFKLLPNYAEERCVGQRGQWKRFLCLADGDDRSTLNMDGSAAVQLQGERLVGMKCLDFAKLSLLELDRAFGDIGLV